MTHPVCIGIDLGTTHTAMALAEDQGGTITSRVVPITQLVAPGAVESRSLLPSTLYFGHESELPLGLPWDPSRSFAVGVLGQKRGAESPGRVIGSAKSWLSHTTVDRRGNFLPQGAAEDVETISPVEASFRLIDHLVESWNHSPEKDRHGPLDELDIVLTVPASFDAAARELTVEAALAAGLANLTLLEEPQAALYAWLERMGRSYTRHIHPGDVVLVIDVGGGTTDFSAIAVTEKDGALELCRVAVGDHILLGGDNMDLLLGHHLRAKLEKAGQSIDRWQMQALTHAAREAKERLLSDETLTRAAVAATGRGSQLLGNTVSTELERADVTSLLLEGYFPVVPSTANPTLRVRSALTQIGLPYAADPAVTRHLAAFLRRQASALLAIPGFESTERAGLLCPTAVLFNGGVLKSRSFAERLLSTLNGWVTEAGQKPLRALPGEDLDLAVARGAAYYGQVRHGRGLRIRGGTARAYYVGVESPAPAVPGFEPPLTALCVAPFGMEEGETAALPPQILGVVVGESVSFRFFGSTVRREDRAGQELEDPVAEGLEELAPIEVTLPTQGRPEGEVVPVRLHAEVSSVGALVLEAFPVEPKTEDEKWKVELSVRGDGETTGD